MTDKVSADKQYEHITKRLMALWDSVQSVTKLYVGGFSAITGGAILLRLHRFQSVQDCAVAATVLRHAG